MSVCSLPSLRLTESQIDYSDGAERRTSIDTCNNIPASRRETVVEAEKGQGGQGAKDKAA